MHTKWNMQGKHSHRMRATLLVLLAGPVVCMSCGRAGGAKMELQVKSSAFQSGAAIPKQYTGDGKNISPPLQWSAGPSKTKSYALIVDDPDAPSKVWVHWVLFNLPPEPHNLDEGIPAEKTLASGAHHGTNDFGKLGYGGPSPPRGKPHRYMFTVFALDAQLELPAGATKAQLLDAMRGHILQQGQLVGTYQR